MNSSASMAMMDQHPKLDSPGAGLPWLENFILKHLYYPWKVSRHTWGENLKNFQDETQKILKIVDKMSEENFQTRILIPRLKGMEDSSRFWSVALTMDHLFITIGGMTMVAVELAKGNPLSITVDTAMVKPKQEHVLAKVKMIEQMEKITRESVNLLSPFEESASRKHKLNHPWFGAIDACGWVWVIGQHQSLHRKQIQMIVERLS